MPEDFSASSLLVLKWPKGSGRRSPEPVAANICPLDPNGAVPPGTTVQTRIRFVFELWRVLGVGQMNFAVPHPPFHSVTSPHRLRDSPVRSAVPLSTPRQCTQFLPSSAAPLDWTGMASDEQLLHSTALHPVVASSLCTHCPQSRRPPMKQNHVKGIHSPSSLFTL